MTAQAQSTSLFLRNDTIFGVCEAIGQDFGFNPNWLRVGFCLPIFWNPAVVIGAYFALGLLVAVSRLAFPDRTVEVHTSAPAQPVADAPAAPIEEREQELVAA